jgi:hypothetical protein
MKEKLEKILAQLDEWIEKENERRKAEEDYLLSKVIIEILGQYSLIMHPDVKLTLFGTGDLDAHIKSLSVSGGVHEIKKKLEQLLEAEQLELESDDHLIWVPPESTFTRIMETPRLKCDVLDPLYTLCSKAIKAPEKNKILIRDALKEYGKPLKDLILKYGGNDEYFTT